MNLLQPSSTAEASTEDPGDPVTLLVTYLPQMARPVTLVMGTYIPVVNFLRPYVIELMACMGRAGNT